MPYVLGRYVPGFVEMPWAVRFVMLTGATLAAASLSWTFFEAPFDPASVAVDSEVSVRRVIDTDGGGIIAGDLVEVRLDYALSPLALDGCYQVTDIAPSGLRPVTRVSRRMISVRLYSASSQSVVQASRKAPTRFGQ